MPTYRYEPCDEGAEECRHCHHGFDAVQALAAPRLERCPRCGQPVRRVVVRVAVGRSPSGLDDRAKAAGFTKLKRLGKGEYERQY